MEKDYRKHVKSMSTMTPGYFKTSPQPLQCAISVSGYYFDILLCDLTWNLPDNHETVTFTPQC